MTAQTVHELSAATRRKKSRSRRTGSCYCVSICRSNDTKWVWEVTMTAQTVHELSAATRRKRARSEDLALNVRFTAVVTIPGGTQEEYRPLPS